MKLYFDLPYELHYKGVKLKLTPFFNNVLYCLEVTKNKELEDEEIIDNCFCALVDTNKRYSYKEKLDIIKKVFELINEEKKNKNTSNKKTFDFIQDSQMIYAGFYQAYKIDLFEQRNKLHWWKFISLFQGLPKETRIMEIIDIRSRPLPKPTKYNGEKRAELIRLKALYSLEMTEEERERQFASGLNSMFDKLKSIAERG